MYKELAINICGGSHLPIALHLLLGAIASVPAATGRPTAYRSRLQRKGSFSRVAGLADVAREVTEGGFHEQSSYPSDEGAERRELLEAEEQIRLVELHNHDPESTNRRLVMTSRPESNCRSRTDVRANGMQLSQETHQDRPTANELQVLLAQQQLENERLNRELKVSEEKAQEANAENKALHSEVKKLQWQKVMSKATKATKHTGTEALKPDMDDQDGSKKISESLVTLQETPSLENSSTSPEGSGPAARHSAQSTLEC